MALLIAHHFNGGRRAFVEMAVIIAAEDGLVEFEPVLKPVAGGTHGNDGLARGAIAFHAFEIAALDRQAAGEEERHVAEIQGFESGQGVHVRGAQQGALRVIAGFEIVLEAGERRVGIVFERAGHEADV